MAVYMVHKFTKADFKQRVIDSHITTAFLQVDEKRAEQLMEEVAKASLLSLDQAEIFARAIVETTKLHQRIVEEYQPGQRTLRREVTIDVRIPTHIMRHVMDEAGADHADATFLYPVIVPPKGVFYDDLHIRDASGQELAILSYREYLHIVCSVIHLLLASACNAPPDALPDSVRECERKAIWGIIMRVDGRPDHPLDAQEWKPDEAGRDLARSLQAMNAVSSEVNRRRAIRMAAQLVEVLTSHYAIIAAVPVPASGRFSIKYESTLIPELDLVPRTIGGQSMPSSISKGMSAVKTRLNILLSTRPVDIKLSLDNAWTCQSYHVLVRCPEGLYLGRQRLIVPQGYLERTARWAPTPPHVRFRRRLGQSYAHFYARFLPPPRRAKVDHDGHIVRRAEKAPKLLLSFNEVPPGSVSGAALAAIASTVLIWIIGYGLTHDHGGILDTDAPALLLAFPGVAASWLGFDKVTRLFEGTLTARLSLACTATISLVATALYLIRKNVSSAIYSGAAHHGGLEVGVLGITLWPWAVLTVVALFNASYLSYRWGINSWRFRYLADREDPAGMVGKVRQPHEDEDQTLS